MASKTDESVASKVVMRLFSGSSGHAGVWATPGRNGNSTAAIKKVLKLINTLIRYRAGPHCGPVKS